MDYRRLVQQRGPRARLVPGVVELLFEWMLGLEPRAGRPGPRPAPDGFRLAALSPLSDRRAGPTLGSRPFGLLVRPALLAQPGGPARLGSGGDLLLAPEPVRLLCAAWPRDPEGVLLRWIESARYARSACLDLLAAHTHRSGQRPHFLRFGRVGAHEHWRVG